MSDARAAGFAVELHYIHLPDAEASAERVAARVAAGGHHIPFEDIVRRFQRSRANFVSAALLADL